MVAAKVVGALWIANQSVEQPMFASSYATLVCSKQRPFWKSDRLPNDREIFLNSASVPLRLFDLLVAAGVSLDRT